jgi:hypothetical protein
MKMAENSTQSFIGFAHRDRMANRPPAKNRRAADSLATGPMTDIQRTEEEPANAPSIFSLTYLSTAAKPFTEQELVELLENSRVNNSRLGITGLLLYQHFHFMQLLEGEKETVLALFAAIRQDPRHHEIVTLLEGPSMQRQFPESSLAFANLESAEVRKLPGLSEFLETPLTREEFEADPSRAQKLMTAFQQRP